MCLETWVGGALQGGHENHIRFPTMPCVYKEEATRTEPLFASGIAMETEALYAAPLFLLLFTIQFICLSTV